PFNTRKMTSTSINGAAIALEPVAITAIASCQQIETNWNLGEALAKSAEVTQKLLNPEDVINVPYIEKMVKLPEAGIVAQVLKGS
ncbi:hypothetical protein KIL84_012088, partial [Mauremys mutica]